MGTVKYVDKDKIRDKFKSLMEQLDAYSNLKDKEDTIIEAFKVWDELEAHEEKIKQFCIDTYIPGTMSHYYWNMYLSSEELLYQYFEDKVCKPNEHDWILFDQVDHEYFRCTICDACVFPTQEYHYPYIYTGDEKLKLLAEGDAPHCMERFNPRNPHYKGDWRDIDNPYYQHLLVNINEWWNSLPQIEKANFIDYKITEYDWDSLNNIDHQLIKKYYINHLHDLKRRYS